MIDVQAWCAQGAGEARGSYFPDQFSSSIEETWTVRHDAVGVWLAVGAVGVMGCY